MEKHGKFEIRVARTKRGARKAWFWVFKASNGVTLCTSQMYRAKESAVNGAVSIQRSATHSPIVVIKE